MNPGILSRSNLFYEYSNLECLLFHDVYRVTQAEYVIRILMAASQEYVNTYSSCRLSAQAGDAAPTTGEVQVVVMPSGPLTLLCIYI